jgi:hypothetical protein
LTTDRPLDHALLRRLLSVQNASCNEVLGRIELDNRETSWLFYPQNSWESGTHQLAVQPELEDLAGNNLHGPLDRRVSNKHNVQQEVILGFVVAKKSESGMAE